MNTKKNDSKKTLHVLLKIFNEVDPESFMPGSIEGAPVNEYEMECRKLLAFIMKNMGRLNIELLKVEIDRIWEEYFNKKCSRLDLLAKRILSEVSTE